MFIETTALNKVLSLRKRIRAVCGGTSASKTISILQWLIDYAQTREGKIVSVVSETMPHLRKGAMRDFKAIMQQQGYWDDNFWNETNSVYTFKHRGGDTIIEFFSVDSSDKVRGPRRDVLFINEANNVPYETFDQLEVRTKEIIWLDWNPVTEFWFYLDELGKAGVISRADVDFLTLTYRDNEALDPRIVSAIEAHKPNVSWWRVYGEGQLGEVEGRVYKDWQQLDDIPHEARLLRYGLDFGYSNDPAALVAIYQYNGGLILDEIIYRKGMSNKDIADVIIPLDDAVIFADSAEPKSIDEIYGYGVSIIPAPKGPDSVNFGIQYVQGQRIWVTKRSVNLLREYRGYLWQVDKDGKITTKPQDFQNHLMDAIRYALSTEINNNDDEAEWEVLQQENQRLFKNRGY